MEYFVRNCVLHRSMQSKHSYLEHEMKYFFKVLAKEQKKSGGHVNTPAFSSTHAGIRARCRCRSTIKDELGYKLGTGKKKIYIYITWYFFTHGAFTSSQEVVETCPCVPDRNGIWKCLFLRRGETEIHGEKPRGARTRTNNKLNQYTCMASTPGFEPGPHW